MKTWNQYKAEHSIFDDSNEDKRFKLKQTIAFLTYFETKDTEQTKDLLLELKSILDNKLSGL